MTEKLLLHLNKMSIGVAEELARIDAPITEETRIFLEGRLSAIRDVHDHLVGVFLSDIEKGE